MDRPRLKAHLVPVITADEKVFLLTENDSFLIGGPAERAVMPLLDGRHTLADVAGTLATSQPLPAILGAIRKFERAGLLASGVSTLSQEQTAFFDAAAIDPTAAADRLNTSVVEVLALGNVDITGMVEALTVSGVTVSGVTVSGVTASGTPANAVLQDEVPEYVDQESGSVGSEHIRLTVVVVDDYLNPALEELNRNMIARGRAWMLVKPAGSAAWFGPVFEPGVTACWGCLRERMDSNRMVEQYLRRFSGLEGHAVLTVAGLPSTRGAIEGLAASAVVRLLATGESMQLAGRIITLETDTFQTREHQVVRLPQCGVCGDPKVMHTDPKLELEVSAVAFTADGGFRTMAPEQTYARLAKHVSRISGAVTWLEKLPDDERGLAHSYSAGHNFAMVRNNMAVLKKNLRGHSGGKGRTDIQAKVSGICEAVERFSGVWTEDRPTIRCRADQLDTRHLLPNELMMFAPEQFQDRERVNADPTNQLHRVPNPFDESLSIDWTTAWSLSEQEPVSVPSAYVWFGHPDSGEHFFAYSDGNGNAAGNTLAEATLQGFLEVVERDAVGIWWYNRLNLPAVDLASFADPYVDELQAYYRSMHRSLWMLDPTTDLGIPVFAALSRREDSPVEDIIVAFGAHFDPKLAALRALTEANQFLPSVRERDDAGNAIYVGQDPLTLSWWQNVRLEDEPWLSPSTAPVRSSADYPVPHLTNVDEYVALGVQRCRAVGYEVLAIDQSRPDIELRVAKVIVPGLRHFWRRLGPGRLYDHPVAHQDLDRPRTFDELNPISVFF